MKKYLIVAIIALVVFLLSYFSKGKTSKRIYIILGALAAALSVLTPYIVEIFDNEVEKEQNFYTISENKGIEGDKDILSNQKNDEKIENNETEDTEIAYEVDRPEDEGKQEDIVVGTVENYTSSQKEENTIIINVEDEVKEIKRKYYDFQQQKDDLQQHPIDKNIKIFYASDKVVSIEVASGYNDIGYSRIYYFDENSKLYFTFIFDKKKENRLYFKNDILIRYIDENGEIFNLYENLESCIWSDLALCEGYELLESVN